MSEFVRRSCTGADGLALASLRSDLHLGAAAHLVNRPTRELLDSGPRGSDWRARRSRKRGAEEVQKLDLTRLELMGVLQVEETITPRRSGADGGEQGATAFARLEASQAMGCSFNISLDSKVLVLSYCPLFYALEHLISSSSSPRWSAPPLPPWQPL